MMKPLKIGVVEDDAIIADLIVMNLQAMGYETCTPSMSYSETIAMVEEENPDLLILDIRLQGSLDGIDVAKVINEKFKVPFIFLSANTDAATLERAKETKPLTFLPKPFNKEVLFTTLEIAFSQLNEHSSRQLHKSSEPNKVDQVVFLKDGSQFRRVRLPDVLYINSEQNYLNIYLNEKRKLVIRAVLTDFIEQYPYPGLMRVHRSYVVNLDQIESFNREEIIIGEHTIPLASTHRDEFMSRMGVA
jgi:two-component system, LytTR family, response regulator LytT